MSRGPRQQARETFSRRLAKNGGLMFDESMTSSTYFLGEQEQPERLRPPHCYCLMIQVVMSERPMMRTEKWRNSTGTGPAGDKEIGVSTPADWVAVDQSAGQQTCLPHLDRQHHHLGCSASLGSRRHADSVSMPRHGKKKLDSAIPD